MSSLQQKKADFTQQLLLSAATELASQAKISEISFKKVADHAGISERTMFRYFTSREAFLDALADHLHKQLQLPPLPNSVNHLEEYVGQLFNSLEGQPKVLKILFDPLLLSRIINTSAKHRYLELITLLEQHYPKCDKALIKLSAANIRYVMSASSWRYYRENFSFDLNTSIQCAQLIVRQSLDYLNQQANL
ncbi:TetR/AcrR family transcriptional regulator [Paraglaciecola aestuariivivens]